MLELTTVVAIAVSCSVLFIVCSVVGTIVWIRIRQEKLSMAMANARSGQYARGLQNFPAETVTELSPEEGAALGQYGQLPYGNPHEWALMESRERLIKPPLPGPETSSQFAEKARSFRNSISRTKSKRASKGGLRRPPRLSSLATLGEASFEKKVAENSPSEHRPSSSREDVCVSAVEGVMELPTETSPRQTPEKEPPGRISVDSGVQSIAGPWSMLMNREYSSGLFPVREDDYEGYDPYRFREIRGRSIATQSPGVMPDQPVPPPPPCAYPPNRFRMSRNESSMRFSSLSLDTADSSILDDGRRTPMLVDSNFNSPALPPCPTFAPFSANDVGRSYSMSRAAVHGSYALPSNSLEPEAQKLERERLSPRRSLTTGSQSNSMERISPPPRRSESVLTNGPKRDSRFASLGNTPVLHPSPNNIPVHWNGVDYNTALLPHFSQLRGPFGHQHRRQESNDSLFSAADSFASASEGPSRNPGGFYVRETPLSDGTSRGPPPSVLKGGTGPRKGHKRQNCVRISIHPPITFGGPVFSPMAEEPEEGDAQNSQKSEAPELSTSNISSFPSVSSVSMDRHGSQDKNHSYRRPSYHSPTRKRKHNRADSGDPGVSKTLPGLVTTLPTRKASLSRTPSPDNKSPALWSAVSHVPSPITHENSPAHSCPRVSAVRGPRSQPGKASRNSIQRPITENTSDPSPTASPSLKPSNSNREPPLQKPSPTLKRDTSNATDKSTTVDRDATEGLEVVNGSQPTKPLAPEYCGVNKTPSTRSGNIVTIWEDKKLERTPGKRSSSSCPEELAELQGDVVFDNSTNNSNSKNGRNISYNTRIERHRSTGGIRSESCENMLDEIKKPARAASQRSTKPELLTPMKKAVGLGIEAITPRSLYDGDGFLKE